MKGDLILTALNRVVYDDGQTTEHFAIGHGDWLIVTKEQLMRGIKLPVLLKMIEQTVADKKAKEIIRLAKESSEKYPEVTFSIDEISEIIKGGDI